MIKYPYEAPALLVEQPMAAFYVVVLPAELLLSVCYSDVLSASYDKGSDSYALSGTQRLPQPKRLDPIAEFIDRTDAVLPNAIILAANHRHEDGLLEDEADPMAKGASSVDRRWAVHPVSAVGNSSSGHVLTIPTADKLAAIIDGQHRLFAFAHTKPERRMMPLVCSVFLDLPKPYQAQIFATINSNQKPVDKSLTYELFGYNISEETSEYWSPDKLAVFLTRRLATAEDSPLCGRIAISPLRDQELNDLASNRQWKVSTAVVVEGIMRLFSNNPKKDSNRLQETEGRRRDSLAEWRTDRSPLRQFYIDGNDSLIYQIVKNYLIACDRIFWADVSSASFITKTVGIQALFDILRLNIQDLAADRDVTVDKFFRFLSPAGAVDFADDRFKKASGSGRSFIRRTIAGAVGGNGV